MKLRQRSEEQKYIGIIGHRLSHTLSPIMHTAALKHLNVDFSYGVMDVRLRRMLPGLLVSLRALNFRGANVTIPYKQAVMPLIDEISEEAKVIGAVNTIVNDAGRLVGYNTDADGVHLSLASYAAEIKNNPVVIFGAGGAARATVYAVAKFFAPKRITIVNRTPTTAKAIADEFGTVFPLIQLFYTNDSEMIAREVNMASLIINTTSVGMKPHANSHPLPPNTALRKDQIVFDIVYNPVNTALLTMAAEAGARTISGIEMLLGQGAKAFELFTRRDFPMHIAREAVMKELTQENK